MVAEGEQTPLLRQNSAMRVLNAELAAVCFDVYNVKVRPSSLDLSKCYAIVILVLSLLYNYMWASLTSFKEAKPQVITKNMHICFLSDPKP